MDSKFDERVMQNSLKAYRDSKKGDSKMKLSDVVTPKELAAQLAKGRWGKESVAEHQHRALDANNPRTEMDEFANAMMPFTVEFDNGLDMFAAVMVTLEAVQVILESPQSKLAAQIEALKFSVASLSADAALDRDRVDVFEVPPPDAGVFESKNACNAEMKMMRSFRKFAETVADSERDDFFHPINRKRWMREFGAWLIDSAIRDAQE